MSNQEPGRQWDYSDWSDLTHQQILSAQQEVELRNNALKELLAEAGIGAEPYSDLSEKIAQDWA